MIVRVTQAHRCEWENVRRYVMVVRCSVVPGLPSVRLPSCSRSWWSRAARAIR